MTQSQAPEQVAEVEPSFLPDFCSARVVLRMVLMAQLLAFILALVSSPSQRSLWLNLALVSLFIQWIALGNVLLLCLNRRWLQKLSPLMSSLGSYGLSLLVTLVASVAALYVTPAEVLGQITNSYTQSGFVTRNMAISAVVSAVALRYFYVQHQWKLNIQAEARSRIQALQARIRPHFLFNSMNTIASLTRTDPELAEKAVEDLADLFRASLGHQQQVPLSHELQFTQRYINIEQLRLGKRLKIEWHIDDTIPSQATVPALILQPLVENSIYHGIEPQTEGGTVEISISKTDHAMYFKIANPIAETKAKHRRAGNRMALDNIRQRLKLAYGNSTVLDINTTPTRYTASFTIPIEKPL